MNYQGIRGKAFAVSLYLFFIGIVSCESPQNSEQIDTVLFRSISAKQSGIQFSNDIKENEQRNFLSYPYFYNGGGVAVGDINQDGLPDLYFTGNMVGDRLYLNKGNLTFEDITQKAGILKQNLWTTGVSFVDINNDGQLDIYVCRSGQRGFRNNLLYINQGNNKFVEQAKSYGLNDNGYATQAYFFDYDVDGDLDMYLVNHSAKFFSSQQELFDLKGQPEPDEADKLFQNQGLDTKSKTVQFKEVSKEAGIQHFGFGLSASIEDFNADGLPDIYVANDFFEPDFLYINQGNGTFQDRLKEYTGHTSFSSMGSDAADINNDGLPDLMVCDMQAADNYRKKANMASMDTGRFARIVREGYHYQYMQNTLQLNTGMGRFSEIAEFAGVAETDWSWGPLFFDMDNDGWKDLFVSNGIRRDIQYKDILKEVGQKVSNARPPNSMDLIQNFPVERLRNYTFQNKAGFSFKDNSPNWGLDFKGFSTGAAYSDLDLDGDLDLVLNNLDDPAIVYENTSQLQKNRHYLQIELRGEQDNHYGIGAKVEIKSAELNQSQSVYTSRGFQSSVEPVLHFGLGDLEKIEEVKVMWPNGTTSIQKGVSSNQRININQKENSTKTQTKPPSNTLFTEISQGSLGNYTHQEIPYDDFAKEILLPHKYSQLGPTMAVADINGDGREDLFIGGAKEYPGTLFIQNSSGKFNPINEKEIDQDKAYEDTEAIFFDADGDGDPDLYVQSGSNEWEEDSPMYQDRLYINDGEGHFTRKKQVLPKMYNSGTCVRAGDFDQDGDLDLFVGGRIVPGKYPLAPRSFLLENTEGIFTDITSQAGADLFSPGLITDALWTDFDEDSDLDLMLLGEWMGLTVMENKDGKFHKMDIPGFQSTLGWWNSLASADMDQDGDLDYVAGNLGLNYKYKTSEAEPFQVYAHDFDANGSLDIVLGYFNQGSLYPLRGKQCSSEQMPFLTKKFPAYAAFGRASLEEIYGEEELAKALHYEATTFSSVYIENLGNGMFDLHDLPVQAQFSAINDLVLEDLDKDGAMDILIAGNMYQSEVETARNDASVGYLLRGDGKGNFIPVSPQKSGFFVPGNAKSLAKIRRKGSSDLYVVGNNEGPLQIFSTKP